VIPDGDDIEIHNVNFIRPKGRRQGIGTEMIRHIREAFPHHHIWVDTWDHSRPFWEAMVAAGYVDSIESNYSWPCPDTNCTTCHPTRVTGRRRAQ
jgi:GNAT superfamily N-acetyltransferase